MMSNIPLVSVVTPCYNGEKWVARLIESVLNQTYPKIEFIIVNDGSTDQSENIILSYETRFQKKGYLFKYIKQDNKGLGGAINTGFKAVTGKYLCWPDADDYLELDSIELRVRFLIENPQYAIVTSNAYVRREDDPGKFKLLVDQDKEEPYKENQFFHLLNGRGIFCPGCHMLRIEALDDVIPGREIYPAKRGQNWQILLPIYYKYKGAFLNKPLYNYMDHPGSMSKDAQSSESIVVRCEEHETILLETLNMIEDVQKVDLQKEKEQIKLKYINIKMMAAKDYNDTQLYLVEYKKKKEFGVSLMETAVYFRMKFKILNRIDRWIRRYRP